MGGGWAKALVALILVGGLAAGCTAPDVPADAPFTLAVVPQELNGFSIVGQDVVYLVTLAEGADPVPVLVSARAEGAAVAVEGPELGPGDEVAEVVVTPGAGSVGRTVTVTVEGVRGRATRTAEATFEVVEGEDDRAERAAELRDRFVAWLEAARPELAITADTAWEGTMVSPQWLVVSHYLFFSDEWEMHVSWHIMVAPHDWARIDLRPRFRAVTPQLAFEIASVSNADAPRPSGVPDAVWR